MLNAIYQLEIPVKLYAEMSKLSTGTWQWIIPCSIPIKLDKINA